MIPTHRLTYPTRDPDPLPDGIDNRTAIMLRAMAAASEDALFGEPGDAGDPPLDVLYRRPVRRWEDD